MIQMLNVLLLSAVPLIEQRGAIPLGILVYKMNPYYAALISFIGSMLPFPFIYFFIKPVFSFIKRKTGFGRWIDNIEKKALIKSRQVTKYEAFGLTIFVGVPLPGTGIWTGSLISVLLNMNFKYSLVSILLGAIISDILITLGVTGLIKVFLM